MRAGCALESGKFFLVAIRGYHVRPFFQERQAHGASQTARTAGHQYYFAGKAYIHVVCPHSLASVLLKDDGGFRGKKTEKAVQLLPGLTLLWTTQASTVLLDDALAHP